MLGHLWYPVIFLWLFIAIQDLRRMSSPLTCGPCPPVMNSATAIQRQSDEVAMALMLRTDALGSLIWLLAEASMLHGIVKGGTIRYAQKDHACRNAAQKGVLPDGAFRVGSLL